MPVPARIGITQFDNLFCSTESTAIYILSKNSSKSFFHHRYHRAGTKCKITNQANNNGCLSILRGSYHQHHKLFIITEKQDPHKCLQQTRNTAVRGQYIDLWTFIPSWMCTGIYSQHWNMREFVRGGGGQMKSYFWWKFITQGGFEANQNDICKTKPLLKITAVYNYY